MKASYFCRRNGAVSCVVAFCLLLLTAGLGWAQGRLTVETPMRPNMVLDSGAAWGRDAAHLPLAGQAPAGAQVVGRFVGASGQATEWQPVATADEAGHWQGQLGPVSRDAGWVRPELRLSDSDTVQFTGTALAAGHVVAIWGQSELHRAVLPSHAALDSAAPVRDPLALQVTFSHSAKDDYGDPSQFEHSAISDQSPVSAHMVALSNMLHQAAPGQRFHLVFHTRSGTGFQQLLSDAAPGRLWSDDLRLHRFALPWGGAPGLAWISWYNSDSGLGERYAQVLYAAITGQSVEGAALAPGDVPEGGRHPLDHSFATLYGPDTVWAVAGPHRFEMKKFSARIAANRAGVDALFARPTPGNLRRALEPLTYLNGNPAWGNGDFSHPDTSAQPADGMGRLMLLMGNSILRQLGLAQWPLPAFDHARLSADGTEVQVWSDAGPVTTTRAVQTGQADAPVAGFQINGAPATQAHLRDGRVVIRFDAQGRAFPPGARLTFGAGGIGAQNLNRDVRKTQVWRDYPIVDVGQVAIEGIPVKAQTPQHVLDVLPPSPDLTMPLPQGNLLPPKVAGFAETDQPPGWARFGEGWELNSAENTARASLTARGGLQAVIPEGAVRGLSNRRLVLTFVPQTTGSDPEVLRVAVSATGGAKSTLFLDEVTLTPGQRMYLPLAKTRQDAPGLIIRFRRRGALTGDISLTGLGLYALR